MKKYFIVLFFFISCSSGNDTNQTPTTYEIIEGTFENSPSKRHVQPLLESVMKKYNIQLNEENTLKVANMLFSLKNESAVGVTEMDILKHIYQHGNAKVDLASQATLSAAILEKTK